MNTRTRFLAMSRANHLEYRNVPFRPTRPVDRMDALPTLLDELSDWILGLGVGAGLVILTVLLFSMGCAPAPDDHEPSAAWCERNRCDREALAFTVAGEGLHAPFLAAMGRMAAATGRQLSTDPQGGIPVVWREDTRTPPTLKDPTGRPACANTTASGMKGGRMYTQRIEIDPTPPPGCPGPELSLVHELIHALAPDAVHLLEPSLFSFDIERSTLDAGALVELCAHFDCNAFEPESY